MQFAVYSVNEWLYPDQLPSGGKTVARIEAPQGGFPGCQILIKNSGGPISWRFHSEDDRLEPPTVYRLIPVYVEKNTGIRGFTIPQGEDADYVTRKAPFWVYDAMETRTTAFEPEPLCAYAGLYLQWPIGHRPAGLYSGIFTVTQKDESIRVSVTLRVSPVELPYRETLRLSNWYSVHNMAAYHDAPLWSEEHWNMIKTYGEMMRHVRQTDFIVLHSLASVIEKENGTYAFDFSRTKQFIELYLSMGFRYIEGEPPVFRKNWADNSFIVSVCGEDVPALSEKGYQYLSDYYRSWYGFLKDNHWLGCIIQHVADEPHEGCAAEYRILSGIVRKYMPGVPLVEAVEIDNLEGAVDIWVPKNNTYAEHQAAFEIKRRQGDTLWFYSCCCPGGYYLNRFLDGALLRTRYLHWGNYLYNLNGYLHWGLNFYNFTDDPFKGKAGVIESLNSTSLPAGDSHIVYPIGKQVLPSVRLEAMRAGCEDYELLRMLEAKNPDAAQTLARACMRSFTDYDESAECFDNVYSRLLQQLEQ